MITGWDLQNFIHEGLEEVKKGENVNSTLQQYEFLKALNERFNVYPNFPTWEELRGGK